MSGVKVAVPPASLSMRRSWLITAVGLIACVSIRAPMAAARPAVFFITPARGSLSSGLGWRADPFRRTVWQHHWGIDIAAPVGTLVHASAAGVVQFAGWYAGYGRIVYIDHGGGWTTLYGHLKRTDVQPGQPVAQGAVIGTVGTNGRSTGPHLHFEIRYKDWPVDPLKYLGR